MARLAGRLPYAIGTAALFLIIANQTSAGTHDEFLGCFSERPMSNYYMQITTDSRGGYQWKTFSKGKPSTPDSPLRPLTKQDITNVNSRPSDMKITSGLEYANLQYFFHFMPPQNHSKHPDWGATSFFVLSRFKEAAGQGSSETYLVFRRPCHF